MKKNIDYRLFTKLSHIDIELSGEFHGFDSEFIKKGETYLVYKDYDIKINTLDKSVFTFFDYQKKLALGDRWIIKEHYRLTPYVTVYDFENLLKNYHKYTDYKLSYKDGVWYHGPVVGLNFINGDKQWLYFNNEDEMYNCISKIPNIKDYISIDTEGIKYFDQIN